MRVAVTGARGRLGRALVAALEDAPFTGPGGPIAWSRPDFDLDRPDSFGALLDLDRPEVVVHAAAWTDVDACAGEPALAMGRNGTATGRLAEACAAHRVDLFVVSTNEVFDGRRKDGRGYGPVDAPNPPNPYGASKLAGEIAARRAFERADARLGIARTAWLFGPPDDDFPSKILAAAERASSAGQALRVVADEWGQPTFAADLAEAIVELIGTGRFGGVHHIVNGGVTSRSGWARELLRQARVPVEVADIPSSEWRRSSTPPAWGVLEATTPPSGEPLRAWPEALADYLPSLLARRAVAR